MAEQIRATTVRLRGEEPKSPQGKADATALAKLTSEQGKLVLQRDQLHGETEEVVQPSGGASVIQEPSPAKRAGLVGRYIGYTMAGVLVALLLDGGRHHAPHPSRPQIHFRDDIADAVGSP